MPKYVLLISLLVISIYTHAYLGPGMGGGVIAAILGFVGAIFLGIWALLYYPIKRYLKNKKNKDAD